MNSNSTHFLNRLRHHEAFPGLLLVCAMLAALAIENTGASWHDRLLETFGTVGIGAWTLQKPLLLWINDGLMAVFFLFIGLELKREVLHGELRDRRKAILPLFAALGGIAVPSLVYAAVNWSDAVAVRGWAIPAATDIAFALGVLAILGSRVPLALKVFLTSVAVFDDIAAIAIIALFYTGDLSELSLVAAVVILLGLFALNRFGVKSPGAYVILGTALWVAVLKSGVHATLAGFTLALFIPAGKSGEGHSPLASRMEHGLHPWVVFAILPVFAFANAGVPLAGLTFDSLLKPVPLGIALGLLVGKPAGVMLASWLAVRLGWARLPAGVGWSQVLGVAMLCGIGFTMSLFIGSLAFEASGFTEYAVDNRLGILAGSFLAAVGGVTVLLLAKPAPGGVEETAAPSSPPAEAAPGPVVSSVPSRTTAGLGIALVLGVAAVILMAA